MNGWETTASSLAASTDPSPVLCTVRCMSPAWVGGTCRVRASIRVEQAQDGGYHDRLLPGRRRAEQVMAGAVLGNADDPVAGSLDCLQVACLEHPQRVLFQAKAEPAFPCYTLTHADAAPLSFASFKVWSVAQAGSAVVQTTAPRPPGKWRHSMGIIVNLRTDAARLLLVGDCISLLDERNCTLNGVSATYV